MEVTDHILPWETIVDMVKKGNLNFGRAKDTMDRYSRHKSDVRKEWMDMNSFCMHTMLGYPYSIEDITVQKPNGDYDIVRRKFVDPDSSANLPGLRILVRDNEFPYLLPPEVVHKVIWSSSNLTVDEYERQVRMRFSEQEYDILVFVNPPKLKSIRGVYHGHVFLRRKISLQSASNEDNFDTHPNQQCSVSLGDAKQRKS